MNPNVIVPVVLFISMFGALFGIAYLRTRENLAILDRGKDPRSPRPYNSLKAGLVLVGGGLGLIIAMIVSSALHSEVDEVPLYAACVTVGGGIGLLISYAIEKKAMDEHPDRFR